MLIKMSSFKFKFDLTFNDVKFVKFLNSFNDLLIPGMFDMFIDVICLHPFFFFF
jgi:hypothetical protein